MIETLNNLDTHWAWLAIGLFLAAAEMVLPGVFLIWLSGAALVTGVLAWLTPINLPLQIVVFGILAIVAVFMGRYYLRDNPIEEVDPKMNRRGERLAGEVATVSQAIQAGSGRVRYGDSEWLAKGAEDAPVGAHVRITGSDGTILLVEPL